MVRVRLQISLVAEMLMVPHLHPRAKVTPEEGQEEEEKELVEEEVEEEEKEEEEEEEGGANELQT
jgi:hypothetical protein